jgi:hypothetical protein
MNSKGLAMGADTALHPLHVSLGQYTSALAKRYISTSGGYQVHLLLFLCANFSGNIWCSVGTIYVSSDARIKKNILDVNDETALDKILIIQPKTYEYKDVINRGTNRVYGFISQQIAEITPESSFDSKRDII